MNRACQSMKVSDLGPFDAALSVYIATHARSFSPPLNRC